MFVCQFLFSYCYYVKIVFIPSENVEDFYQEIMHLYGIETEKPGRVHLSGTHKLLGFIYKLLILIKYTFTNKKSSQKFKLLISRYLVHRFLQLNMIDCLCLQDFSFAITLSNLFKWWQQWKPSGIMFTPVNNNTLQIFSSRTSFVSADPCFNLIVSRLLYCELVTALYSNWMILAGKWELNLSNCFNSEWTLQYFEEDVSKNSPNFVIDIIKDPWVNISKFLKSSFLLIFSDFGLKFIHFRSKFIHNYKSKNVLKIIFKMVEAWNDAYSTTFIWENVEQNPKKEVLMLISHMLLFLKRNLILNSN